MPELNNYLEELDLWEIEHRVSKAKRYSNKVRKTKRRINIDWQSEDCTMYILAGALLLALVTMIL